MSGTQREISKVLHWALLVESGQDASVVLVISLCNLIILSLSSNIFAIAALNADATYTTR